MEKIYKPRYPTRNAGFWFVAVSLLLSYSLGAMLVIGIINNSRQGSPFNWEASLVVMGIAALLLVISVLVVYRIMRIKPKQVVLEEDRMLVQDLTSNPPRLEAEIPFNKLSLVTITDVPVEGGLFPASFKGLLLRWEAGKGPVKPGSNNLKAVANGPATLEYVLSSRNICDFDELFEIAFERAPEAARGAKIFRP